MACWFGPPPAPLTFVAVCLLLIYPRLVNAAICSGTCEYHFHVRHARSMTYSNGLQTYDIEMDGDRARLLSNSWHLQGMDPLVGTYVNSSAAITVDGHWRNIIVINGQFPGPDIEVMEGSKVVVHVTNHLILDGLTIHWHGQLQMGNPWMDGVAYVTQCPIMPREKFTYRFKAEQTGTHWYHAHFTNQRLDGLYGMLVVHKQAPAISYDLVAIQDWIHLDSISTHVSVPGDPHSYSFPGSGDVFYHPIIADTSIDGQWLTLMKFYSVIVNGRGRFTESIRTPLTQFQVSEGQRHRFRMAHVGSDYLLKVSIDDHPLIAVAADGYEFEPIIVDSIILHPGETMDFEILANQQPRSYWMRVDTLQGRPDQNGRIKGGKAIVSYVGYVGPTEPTSTISQCSQNRKCSVFNCPYPGYPTDRHTECISLADARSTLDGEFLKQNFGLLDTDYHELFYSFSVHHEHLTINGRVHEHSRVPFFQDDAREYMDLCDLSEECSTRPCICAHVENLPYNRTVQMVVFSPFGHHNLHLHGHNLAVLAIGFPSFNTSSGTLLAPNQDIYCIDNPISCLKFRWNTERPSLNLVNPPVKNTVVVPALGYVVVRFRTNNPGVWYFHCHHEFHMTSGMDMIMNEAAEKRHPPPEGFPTCGDFSWSDDDYEDYISHTTDTPTEESSTAQPTQHTEIPCDNTDREDPAARSDYITMSMGLAVGLVFALLGAGVVLTLVAITCFHCLVRKRSTKMV